MTRQGQNGDAISIFISPFKWIHKLKLSIERNI